MFILYKNAFENSGLLNIQYHLTCSILCVNPVESCTFFIFTFYEKKRKEEDNMPKNTFQGFIFGLIMSYAMAYGMEVYNVAIRDGVDLTAGGFSNMTNAIFLEALEEAVFMGLIVLLISSLWGNRLGAAIGARHCNPEKDNPYICRLMRQAGTIAVMCPTMSLVASVLFNIILGDSSVIQLPAIWIGTLLKNFPMAFFWNMFAAAPFTHWLFGKIFREQG